MGSGVGVGAGGYVANPQEMLLKAQSWAEMSAEMQSMAADAAGTKSDFGLVKRAEPAHDKISGAAAQWSGGAGTEFEVLRNKLSETASRYINIEEHNTGLAGR